MHEILPQLTATGALLNGKGVFSTLRIASSLPFLWEKHWRRIAANAEKIGLDISEYDEASVVGLLDKAVKRDSVINGRARITFYDESPSPTWSNSTEEKTDLSIITGDLRPIPKEFKLTVSPHLVNTTSPIAGVKSCNYLENVLALDEAKGRGFHEAVRLNERGEVTSGCMANLFWQKGGALYTPNLATGCLAGTTREFVLENLDCEEVIAELKTLNTADEIFLTSAGIDVVQVAEFEEGRLKKQHSRILELLPTRN